MPFSFSTKQKFVKHISQLLVTFALVMSLAGCFLFSSLNKTPINWSISDVYGFGYTLLVEDALFAYGRYDAGYKLVKVDLESRKIAWKSEASFTEIVRPTIITDTQYIYTDTGSSLNIYDFDGREVVSVTHLNGADSNLPGVSLLIQDDIVYVPNGNSLYVYDVAQINLPKLLWQYRTPRLISGLVVDQSGIYIAHHSDSQEINLLKLDLTTAEMIWQSSTYDASIDKFDYANHMQIIDDQLIVDAWSRYISYDLNTGAKYWISEPIPCGVDSYQSAFSFVEVEGVAYRNCDGGSAMQAINLEDGRLIWTVDFVGNDDGVKALSIGGRSAYLNGKLYASHGQLIVLDAATGNVLSASTTDVDAIKTYVQVYKDEILVWGQNLTLFKALP